MKALTPALAQALETLDRVVKDGSYSTPNEHLILAAYRAAPDVEGPWYAFEDEPGRWWIDGDPGNVGPIAIGEQRTAEAYRDFLNLAEASLKEAQ